MMKINFDLNHNPEYPTLLLTNRSGKIYGQLDATDVDAGVTLSNGSEFSFTTYKEKNGIVNPLWDEIIDFKLVWWKEQNLFYEITVQIDEDSKTVKTVNASSLAENELSQINVYELHVNNEEDPNVMEAQSKDDRVNTILYDPLNAKFSLLNRLLEKAPHYEIVHVDANIANINRTYDFDGKSIRDCFNQMAEEEGYLFILEVKRINGQITRQISVYDLQNKCNTCGERTDNLSGVCPHCGSTDMTIGYGEDTTIFVNADELGEKIGFSSNADQVKNCFRLEAGDDLMTATVRNCNPNGTDYIWHLSDIVKEDMSEELRSKINQYNDEYEYYRTSYPMEFSDSKISEYNDVITNTYNKPDMVIDDNVLGYSNLMESYYNILDAISYVEHEMMPDVETVEENATQQAALLTVSNMSPVAVSPTITSPSEATVNSAVLDMAKVVCDSTRFKITIHSGSTYSNHVWTGRFNIENYADEEDTATSNTISITINNDYTTYVKRKIDKLALREDSNDLTVSWLYKKDTTVAQFTTEIQKYGYEPLKRIRDCGQKILDLMVEQGTADKQTWGEGASSPYTYLYVPYSQKVAAADTLLSSRESDLVIMKGKLDKNGNVEEDGVKTILEKTINEIHEALDFEKYLGTDLWLEFCAYRRDDQFSNDNFISDGYNTAEIFARAKEFLTLASNELYKSAELQHSITTTLRNLLYLDKFEPILDMFEVGNWIRVQVDDKIYKLRLIEYQVDFDNFENISVKFSDVMNIQDGISDVKSVLDQAQSMATSYSTVQKQATKGNEANKVVDTWFEDGLDATKTIITGADNQAQTWDEHGMLFRRYESVTDDYDPIQMKIINSTIAITDDNWQTIKTAVGNFYYVDPSDGVIKNAYGINGEVIVGKLILGQELGIYNGDSKLKFNGDGLEVSNDINRVIINPNNNNLFKIQKNISDTNTPDWSDTLWFDSDGNGNFTGKIDVVSGNNEVIIDPNGSNIFVIKNGSNNKIWMDSSGNAHFSGKIEAADISSSTFTAYTDDGSINGVFEIKNNLVYSYGNDPFAYVTDLDGTRHSYYTRAQFNTGIITVGSAENFGTGIYNSDYYYELSGATLSFVQRRSASSKTNVFNVVTYIGHEAFRCSLPTTFSSTVYDKNGSEVTGSDRNLKYDIHDLDNRISADFIYSLRPSEFKYDEGTSGRYHHGFIAQDVKQSMGSDDWGVYVQSPVRDGETQFLGLRYEEFIADIVATLQYQRQQIEELQREVF